MEQQQLYKRINKLDKEIINAENKVYDSILKNNTIKKIDKFLYTIQFSELEHWDISVVFYEKLYEKIVNELKEIKSKSLFLLHLNHKQYSSWDIFFDQADKIKRTDYITKEIKEIIKTGKLKIRYIEMYDDKFTYEYLQLPKQIIENLKTIVC